jgi:hypothetical protein
MTASNGFSARALTIGMIVLVLVAFVLTIEYGLRHLVFRPWTEVDLVNNPDHRMTKAMHPEVNLDGIREPFNAEDYRDEDFNVIFLGDSFIYGWKLNEGKTIPAVFQASAKTEGITNLRSINFGWVSSSPFLSKRLLKDIGRKYKPDLVVLALDMTDIFDDRLYENVVDRQRAFNYGRHLPAITMAVSRLNQRFGQSDVIANTLFGVPGRRFFIVEKPLEETRGSFDNTMKNIDEIRAHSRDVLGVPFALFILPRHFQFDARLSPDNWEKKQYPLLGPHVHEPFRYFAEKAKTRDYPIVSLLEDFKNTKVFPTTFADDPHFNEDGAAIAAKAMFRELRAVPGLLPGPVAARP